MLKQLLDILFYYGNIEEDEFNYMSEKMIVCNDYEFEMYEKHYYELNAKYASEYRMGRR